MLDITPTHDRFGNVSFKITSVSVQIRHEDLLSIPNIFIYIFQIVRLALYKEYLWYRSCCMEDDLAISCQKANEEVPLTTDQQLRKPLGLVGSRLLVNAAEKSG